MSEDQRIARLRHDLANPLAAILAETQLLLLQPARLPAEAVAQLRSIEQAAVRMRVLLRESSAGDQPG